MANWKKTGGRYANDRLMYLQCENKEAPWAPKVQSAFQKNSRKGVSKPLLPWDGNQRRKSQCVLPAWTARLDVPWRRDAQRPNQSSLWPSMYLAQCVRVV